MEPELNALFPEYIPLFPGIELSYTQLDLSAFSHRHEDPANVMQISYCRAGQLLWSARGSGCVLLNPGDFSVHTLDLYSTFRFPTGQYLGLTIRIDLREVSAQPPELLRETELFPSLLRKKLCLENRMTFLAGSEESEQIFSAFYGQPEELQLPYQRLKVLELLLYLARLEVAPQICLAEYPADQMEIVRKIHDEVLQHLERRITIEELSRQHLINPTTLKAAFKAAYGTSLAAHIKRHRMERAAEMLRETGLSISEIAAAVGYESQSKFAAAFKNQFLVLPTAYRKQNQH